MKPFIYLTSLVLLFSACRHQKSVTGANASNYSQQQKDTTVVVNATQTHSQGDVVITTSDYSTSATIIINNPPDTEVTTTVVAATADTMQDYYRLTVSFISKGQGIDLAAEEAFVKWLKEQPKHPAYEVTSWGREGEKNYCLKLTELSTREQEIFVRDVRTQLTDKELVFVSEYAKCKGKKVD